MKIVFLGDSTFEGPWLNAATNAALVANWGVTSSYDGRIHQVLANILEARGHPVSSYNEAVSGKNSATCVSDGLLQDALDLSPDIVVLNYGVNDEGYNQSPVLISKAQFKTNMGAIIEACQAAGASVVLSTCVYVDYPSHYLYDRNATASLGQFSDAIIELAHTYGCTLADVRKAFKDSIDDGTWNLFGAYDSTYYAAWENGDLTSEDVGWWSNIHPWMSGTTLMAETIADAMEAYEPLFGGNPYNPARYDGYSAETLTLDTPPAIVIAPPISVDTPTASPLVVTVKPKDRGEFALSLTDAPTYSFASGIGMEAATVPCERIDWQLDGMLGASLRIHGTTGIVWQGIVTRRPSRHDPLQARGWGWCMSLPQQRNIYCATDTSGWKPRFGDDTVSQAWNMNVDGPRLKATIAKGQEHSGHHGWVREFRTTSAARLSFAWARRSTDYAIGVWRALKATLYDGDDPSWTLVSAVADYGTGDLTGTATIDVTDITNALLIRVSRTSAATATSDAVNVTLSSVKLYGTSVTSPTTTNVLKHLIAQEITTRWLPSGDKYLAWVAPEATVIEPLMFDVQSSQDKVDEISKYAPNDFGWYTELVEGARLPVPHWYARSTEPDYLIMDEECESIDLDECDLADLCSAARVAYTSDDGQTLWATTYDADLSHPLVAAGIIKTDSLAIQSSSSTIALAVGTAYVADNGRRRVRGDVTTRTVHKTNGADAYLPSVRPGKMVRVPFDDGYVDATIKRVTCVGDVLATITLDNEPYSLALMLARLAKNQ